MNHAQQNACSCSNSLFPQVDEILAHYQGVEGSLIPVLQQAQKLHGYLSQELIKYIAGKLAIPVSHIYGVVTFYSQFHLNPRGKHIIRVCQGTACHVRGGKMILQAMEDNLHIAAGQTTADQKFTLETVACIGACGLSPVMMIDEDTHGRLTPESIAEVLQRYA
jgi:NADH-quinone oxidoreductase E subunit